MENDAYLKNYLALLDLRLYTLLGLCPEETRDAVRAQLTAVLENGQEPELALTPEELTVCAQLSDLLDSNQEALLAEIRNSGSQPRIELLRERFGLNAKEMVLLTAVLAPALDERFRRYYKLFQNSEEPRMELLLSLIDTGEEGRYANIGLLDTDGRLMSCSLIETVGNISLPGPQTAYRPAPGMLAWLAGSPSTAFYQGRAVWQEPSAQPEKNDPAIISAANVIEMAEIDSEPQPLVSFYGPDDERLTACAKELADRMGRPLLTLDLRELDADMARPLISLALRDAVMQKGILALRGMDQWIDSSGMFTATPGRMLERWAVPVVFMTRRNFVFSPNDVVLKRLVLRIRVEGLTGTKRFGVWKEFLSGLQLGDDLDDESLRTLAGQFTLNTSQIRAAVSAGLGKAVTEERDLSISDLYEGARASSMHHLSDLAKKIEARYTLKDLILPEKQALEINQLIAMARNRSLVLEDWGVGKKLVSGQGISALFTGVPGTGKTLTAQVIAGELGLELYRVDLSTVVSKYIGETEKNLERIFTEAQNSNVILFFDEADSLFGRRSEVGDSHDRYANIEVGYLLQRIETYDGIVLMATNLGANLDEAFARRIHFIIDFPFPDEDTRLRLWELLLPENIEKEPDIDLWPFAVTYKIAGGNIRNAVVWAIYEAARNKRPLSRDDLMNGVEREYQKMGKVFQRLR